MEMSLSRTFRYWLHLKLSYTQVQPVIKISSKFWQRFIIVNHDDDGEITDGTYTGKDTT